MDVVELVWKVVVDKAVEVVVAVVQAITFRHITTTVTNVKVNLLVFVFIFLLLLSDIAMLVSTARLITPFTRFGMQYLPLFYYLYVFRKCTPDVIDNVETLMFVTMNNNSQPALTALILPNDCKMYVISGDYFRLD